MQTAQINKEFWGAEKADIKMEYLTDFADTIIGVDSLENMIEKARSEEEKLHEYYRVSWRK